MELGETVSPAALQAATKKLQSIMPLKHDVRILAEFSNIWLSLYDKMFSSTAIYKSSTEVRKSSSKWDTR